MFKKTAIAAAIALLPLQQANAVEFLGNGASHFSYNYADILFVDNDFDSGFMGRGSYDVTGNIAVMGSYLVAGDYTALSIGAAHHAQADFLDRADLVLHASFDKVEYDFPTTTFLGFVVGGGGFDDSGFTFGATLRHELQDKLELFGDVSYSTVFDGDIQFTGGAVYSFSDTLSVVGSYQLADLDTLSLGVRYYFK